LILVVVVYDTLASWKNSLEEYMAKIIVEELFSDPLGKAGVTVTGEFKLCAQLVIGMV